jgi:signal transduction histidine kinase
MDRDYIQQVMATNRPYLSVPILSRTTGIATVVYAVPILDDQGKLRAILTGGISLSALSDAMVRISYGPSTRASIIDTRSGLIVADALPERILTQLTEEDEAAIGSLTGEGGAIETIGSTGEKMLVGFASVPDLSWGVLVTTPSNIALVSVDKLMQQAIVYTSIIIFLTAVLGAIWMFGITRPIIHLRDAAREMASGDFSRRVNLGRHDEIGDLGNDFDSMANSLCEKDRELREHAIKLEEQVRLRTEALSRSNADLEQFAYVASHDLQEPLRMVSSFMELVKNRYQDKLDADGIEFIGYAVDGAKRMQTMINDLLTYSRVGTRGKKPVPVNLESAMELVLLNLREAIIQNKALITHEKLPTIMADDGQMVSVLQNLIGNAIKFRGEEIPKIHITAEDRGVDWLFSVKDNGVGIDPEFKDRIFIIFKRLHSKDKYEGSGIGLSTCKRIIERHGGKIWVESQLGEGATFYFTIPKQGGGE